MQAPSTGTTSRAYMLPPGTGFAPLTHTPLGTEPLPEAYMQPLSIGYRLASHAIPTLFAKSTDNSQPSNT